MANVQKTLYVDSESKNLQSNRSIIRSFCLLPHYFGNLFAYLQSKRPNRYESREDNRISKSELESASIVGNTTILLSDKNVHRGNVRISGREETKENPQPRSEIGKKERRKTIMPTQTLSANSYIYFTFSFQGGFLRSRRIMFYVESEFPIDTFIVDESGFREFQSGGEYTYYGGFRNVTEHRQQFVVPHEGIWYLIVSNNQNTNTAIHYEVS